MLGKVAVGVIRAAIYRAHSAVIFAIAQLSCFICRLYATQNKLFAFLYIYYKRDIVQNPVSNSGSLRSDNSTVRRCH